MLKDLARAVVVMGKGGVGKTTVAAALATLAAGSEPAVLVEFGDGESGRRALGPSGLVEHIVILPDEALARGSKGLFGSGILSRVALDNFAMRPLLRAAPAIRELAMLESVRQILAERPRARVIVDMPATGHGIAWLRTAKQGRDFLGSGPLFSLCDRVARELIAPGRLSPVIVTLPERLVLDETLELVRALAADPGVPAAAIVVNRVPMEISPEVLAAARREASSSPAAARLQALLEARLAASHEASLALAEVSGHAVPIWRLPLRVTDPHAHEVAATLGALAEAA
jgi:arsenite-transporting ATPase